jgi:hypothetical protein
LGAHAEATPRQRSVALAEELVTVRNEVGLQFSFDERDVFDHAKNQVNTDTLHALRKITEILEDDFAVNLGHSKFARLASTAATLSSFVAVSIAGYNLLQSAVTLDRAAAEASSLAAIKEKYFNQFYRATCLFVVECFLLATPFSYKFAWQGTRFLNNRVLYRLRGVSSRVYRYVLSEIHYVIRGIGAEALRSVDEYSTYLVTVTVQTIELIQEYPDEGIGDLPGTIKEVVEEFHSFVKDAYDIVVPDVNIESLVQDILSQLGGFLDVSAASATDVSAQIDLQ